MNYAAVDYETYYSAEVSITVQGVEGYILHPEFQAYQVSIVTADWEWVGDPSDAPWHKISGPEWEWCAHNASFDERVHHYLKLWSKVPSTAEPHLWHCTADLCAYSAAPRSLANASNYLYQDKVSKDYRSTMKGTIFATLPEEKKAMVREAGLIDGRKCLRFWTDLSPKWPESERRLSRLTRQQGWRGLRMDMTRIQDHIHHLKGLTWAAEQNVPWADTGTSLSYPRLCEECRKVGIEAPASIAKTDVACAEWEETYGDRFKWIDAMRVLRSAGAFLKKLETMRDRTRTSDGRMPYANKYWGAHTGRFSDGSGEGRTQDSGFNSRNLPQGEMFGEEWFLGKEKDGVRAVAKGKNYIDLWQPPKSRGVDLRRCLIPAEGHHFVVPDLSQIEPRVLWSYAGDHDALDLVRTGMSPYEAHARATMNYTLAEPMDEGDPDGYRLAKARVLALGYQAGWVKFITMARIYKVEACFNQPVSEEDTTRFVTYLQRCRVPEWLALWGRADAGTRQTYTNSWLIVSGFRKSNPLITKLWRKLDRALRAAVKEDRFEIKLPSGRSLTYRKIAIEDGEVTGVVIKNGKPTRIRLYGGLLTENLVQATARDVFAACLLRLDDAGYKIPLNAHDEAVTEVPLSVPVEAVQEIMSQPPSWMPNLPVASKCFSTLHYMKK